MRIVQPDDSRLIIEQTPEGRRLTLPRKTRVIDKAYYCFVLAGWLVVGVFVVGFVIESGLEEVDLMFVGLFLSFWAIMGVVFLLKISWSITGKETITISGQQITRRLQLKGLSFTRKYDRSKMTVIHVSTSIGYWLWYFWGDPTDWFTGRQIVLVEIDYRDITLRWGVTTWDVSEAESIRDFLLQKP